MSDRTDPTTTDAAPAAAPRRGRLRSLLRTRSAKGMLTAVTLAAIGSVGVFTTQATFTDQVTMASVSVAGGTLDLTANSGNGPNQAWSVSMNTTNMAPGQTQSGDVIVKNNGTLPFTISVTSTGTDASGCFSYHFREVSATGATKAASWPVNLTGMGTNATADGTTANMATSVTNLALPDNTGSDLIWETDDTKTYTLTVRMKTACTTNGATGTQNFTFNATQ